jgi:hypothetical protein
MRYVPKTELEQTIVDALEDYLDAMLVSFKLGYEADASEEQMACVTDIYGRDMMFFLVPRVPEDEEDHPWDIEEVMED